MTLFCNIGSKTRVKRGGFTYGNGNAPQPPNPFQQNNPNNPTTSTEYATTGTTNHYNTASTIYTSTSRISNGMKNILTLFSLRISVYISYIDICA